MAGSTDRGRRRRTVLVDAAVALLDESGPEAVTARAVAERAGVPLGSVTYYFDDVQALRREATGVLGDRHLDVARSVAGRAGPGQDAASVAGVLAAAVLGPAADGGPDAVRALYARVLDTSGRAPLTDPLRRWDAAVAEVVADVLRAAGRRPEHAPAVLACADGAALAALLSGHPDPLAAVRDRLAGVLDLLAAAEPGR